MKHKQICNMIGNMDNLDLYWKQMSQDLQGGIIKIFLKYNPQGAEKIDSFKEVIIDNLKST